MKRPMKASRHAFGLVALAALGAASGCVSHSTGETEVGERARPAIRHQSTVIENFLELRGCGTALFRT